MFVRNELMALLQLKDWEDVNEDNYQVPEYPQEILDKICDYAIEQKIIEDGTTDRDIFDTEVMGKFPSFFPFFKILVTFQILGYCDVHYCRESLCGALETLMAGK